MKRLTLLLFLVCIQYHLFAQIKMNVLAGALFAKGRYSGDWKNTFNTNTNTGWAVGTGVEIPLSKKVFINAAVELASKKFTYKLPPPSLFNFQRTEECMYAFVKPSLQVVVFERKQFNITAGAGLFAGTALSGKYDETSDAVFGTPVNVSGKLKFGNASGNSYKKTDAGFSLQITARYKQFILPVIADFSFVNNIPGSGSAHRKWQSLFFGLGYSFLLSGNKKN